METVKKTWHTRQDSRVADKGIIQAIHKKQGRII